jgi:AraC-like DNA-binding protein
LSKFDFKNKRFFNSAPGNRHESIGYLLKGNVEIKSKKEHFCAESGDIIYIPMGEIYTSDWHGSPDIEFYSLRYVFAPSKLQVDKASFIKRYKLQMLSKPGVDIRKKFERLHSYHCKNDVNLYMVIAEFYSLYGELNEMLQLEKLPFAKNLVLKAITFIENNPSADFNVPDLAKLCNMSESRFYNLFKVCTGLTPIEYKNRIRIQQATEMLSYGDCTVEWISNYLNFSSPAYFRRVFKKISGTNPGIFRDTIKIL